VGGAVDDRQKLFYLVDISLIFSCTKRSYDGTIFCVNVQYIKNGSFVSILEDVVDYRCIIIQDTLAQGVKIRCTWANTKSGPAANRAEKYPPGAKEENSQIRGRYEGESNPPSCLPES
jgi:hypothetical protein